MVKPYIKRFFSFILIVIYLFSIPNLTAQEIHNAPQEKEQADTSQEIDKDAFNTEIDKDAFNTEEDEEERQLDEFLDLDEDGNRYELLNNVSSPYKFINLREEPMKCGQTRTFATNIPMSANRDFYNFYYASDRGDYYFSDIESRSAGSKLAMLRVTAYVPGKRSIYVIFYDENGKDLYSIRADFTVERQEDIKIYAHPSSIAVGEQLKLENNIFLNEYSYGAILRNKEYVYWSSSNEKVATIVEKGKDGGLVTALSEGQTTITARSYCGSYFLSTTLTVGSGGKSQVNGISFAEKTIQLAQNETKQLKYSITPVDANNKQVLWSVNKSDVLEVDKNGNCKALRPGSAEVTVITVDGNCTDTVNVTVGGGISVNGLSLNETSKELKAKETYAGLKAIITPENASNKKISWLSSNPNVVTVDENGKLTTHEPGFASILAMSDDGKLPAFCNVTVKEKEVIVPVEDILFVPNLLEIQVGDEKELSYQIIPKNANAKSLFFKSVDDSIVSVDQQGKIIGKAAGSTRIIVETKDGLVKASCLVTVVEKKQTEIVNLAKTAAISSNSVSSNAYKAEYACDGLMDTRWLAKSKVKDVYLLLEFEKETDFNHIKLKEYGKRIDSYAFQYWDGSQWKTITSGNRPEENFEITFNTVTSSKLRLMVYNTFGNYGASIHELEVYHQ